MGEAYLHQNGGRLRFRGLSAALPSPYNVFYNGQEMDFSRAVIQADLGQTSFLVAPGSCTFSHTTAETGMTAVTATYQLGGMARSAQIPITVIPTSGVFNDNSWDVIAQAAYYGFPKLIWSPGDEKTEVIDGVTHTWRIIGFDHDGLSEGDANYSDPVYNGGSKKTALSLQWKTPAGSGRMMSEANRQSGYWWKQSEMRTVTLPALLERMPEGLKSNVRTVDKWCSMEGIDSERVELWERLAETIFLPDHNDSNYILYYLNTHSLSAYNRAGIDFWREMELCYPWFSGGYKGSSGEWSRTAGDGTHPGTFLQLSMSGSTLVYKDWYSAVLPYYPIFNL